MHCAKNAGNSPGYFLTQPDFHSNFNLTMKKALLLLLAVVVSVGMQAQICMRDSTVLQEDSTIILPRPYSDTYPYNDLATACIGQPYLQSFTLAIPDTFLYNGAFAIPINSASIATSGALTGQPAGITYLCDPPNCVFNANTLGCILLYGTPTAANTPGNFNLLISATVNTAIFPVPVTFPGDVAPGSYSIVLNAAGNCNASSVYDLSSQIIDMKNQPNPFTGQTTIEVESTVTGEFQFEVFDLMGKKMHQQTIRMFQGNNQFTFDAGSLTDGTYFYSLSNSEGKATRRMVVAK